MRPPSGLGTEEGALVIEGAAILAAGAVLGWVLRSGWYRLRRGKPIQNMCECTHSWSYHDEAGQCGGVDRVRKYDTLGDFCGHEDKPCTCKRYCGPVPVEAYGYQQLGGGG